MARDKKTAKVQTPASEESVVTATPESSDINPPEDTPSSVPDVVSEPESAKDQERQEVPHFEKIPLPFTATVNVALAVLRTAPDSPLMDVRPVGTLPLGTPVTITAIHAGSAQLRNGLWIKTEFLTPNSAKNTL